MALIILSHLHSYSLWPKAHLKNYCESGSVLASCRPGKRSSMQGMALLVYCGLMFISARRRLLYLSRSQRWVLPVTMSFVLIVILSTTRNGTFRIQILFYVLTQSLLLLRKRRVTDAAQDSASTYCR